MNTALNIKILPENTYTSHCRGTLGEFFQGPYYTEDGVDIAIISAVTDKYVRASYTINDDACNLEDIGKIKVKKAIANYCRLKNIYPPAGTWCFESELKVGTGMSSSTSDIVAALKCFSSYFREELTFYDIVNSISNIDRSDTVFLETPCLYLSQKQQIVDIYRTQKKIYCYYATGASTVDTLLVKDILIEYYIKNKKEYLELLNNIYSSFKEDSVQKICDCSTKSALLSQEILPKDNFWHFHSSLQDVKSDGLIVAHTGSLIGLLFCNKPINDTENNILQLFDKVGLRMEVGIIG